MMKKVLLTLLVSALGTVAAFAQNVTGQVQDSQREAVIGAGVIVVGQSGGAITDLDGRYSITAKPGDILEFSAIGYQTTRVTIGTSSVVDVILPDDINLLDEAIVTGYGSVSRKNLTTAIAKVEADKVDKVATANMNQMLMGRAAGLQATMQSAQPGGGVSVTIRGGGTPIYVVDGIVMPGDALVGSSGGTVTTMPSSINRAGLAGINPEDIESIEVLKDASASIYGVNAANGVILITTKKGREGKLRVTYDGAYSLVTLYPYMEMLSGKDYMTYVNKFQMERYLYNNKMGAYGPNAYDGNAPVTFSDAQIAAATTDTNWIDYVLRNGHIHNHNLTINGGTERVKYYVSGNFFQQEGNVQNNDMQRFIIRSNVSAKLADFITVSSNLNFNKSVNHNGTVGSSSQGRGAQAGGMIIAALSYPNYVPVKDENGNYSTWSYYPNAVAMLDMTDQSNQTLFTANFNADVDIVKNMLKFKAMYGFNIENDKRSCYIPSTVFFDGLFRSRGSVVTSERYYDSMEATLNFDHKFFDALQVNAMAGVGRYTTDNEGLGVAYTDTYDAIQNYNIAAASGVVSPSSWKRASEKRSFFSTLSLDLLDRYVLAGTLRRDGTDKFFPGHKYSWFPSISGAWKIYNEGFMKGISWINMLKLRASIGVTGSDTITDELYSAYSPNSTLVKFDQNTTTFVPVYLSSQEYSDITWQKTIMKNIGLDFVVLDNRLSGSFDIFANDITDMLTYGNTSALDIMGSKPINYGHIRRHGWDATITSQNIVKHDFNWSSTLTLSRYKAYWIEREPNYTYGNDYQIRENEPTSISYFYETDGFILPDKSNMPSYQPEGWQDPGQPVIVDQNGDGTITIDDIVHKDGFPTLYLGFGNTFQYKNWDLDIFMYSQLGVVKGNTLSSWSSINDIYNAERNQSIYVKDIYHSTDNYKDAKYPGIANALMASAPLPGNCGTDLGREKADFLRVRNITLGYNFNTRRLGIGNVCNALRLYFDVQNPFTFTSFRVFDPEINTYGNAGGKANGGEYPMTRSWSFGLKVSFN